MIKEEAIIKLRELLGPDYFSTDAADLVLYAADASSNPRGRPDAVARPRTAAEVSALVGLANEYGFPVIPRGAGSGLTGGALPTAGGLMVVMTRFNRILEIDEANLTAEVEPGVVTAAFQIEVEKKGLFYPPDPASREFSTLGGNAAENAGGTRAVKYGVTRDYILGLEVVLGTGEVIRTGVRTAKGVVGYDLTRLLVGSEGTLGIITKLILRLTPRPEARETLIAWYRDLAAAARTVAALTAARVIPATMEFMDRASLDCVGQYLKLDLNPEVGALLLVETDGPPAQALAEIEITRRLAEDNGAFVVKRAETRAEAEEMWQARRALSPALFRAASGKANEDVVVPRSRIPEMIDRLEDISRRRGVRIISFGHAGDGNIHVNVMYDLDSPSETALAETAIRDVFQAALDLGGTLSGEHGVGSTKRDFIDMEIAPESIELMKRVKLAFDPNRIMNPHKIFPS